MVNKFALLGFAGTLAVVPVLVLLVILVFEIAMFVSVLGNESIAGNTKALWVLGMLLLHPFVAIAYYFTEYKK